MYLAATNDYNSWKVAGFLNSVTMDYPKLHTDTWLWIHLFFPVEKGPEVPWHSQRSTECTEEGGKKSYNPVVWNFFFPKHKKVKTFFFCSSERWKEVKYCVLNKIVSEQVHPCSPTISVSEGDLNHYKTEALLSTSIASAASSISRQPDYA